MFATQYLLPSSRNSIAAVDEARPVGRNKRFSFGRKDTKPRLFVPTKRKSAMRIKAAAATSATTPNQMNAVLWLQGNDCPMDVMPKILAYAGPQMAQTLSKCNHFWNNVMQDEATWRSLCEELYKVCFYSIVVLFDAIVAIAGPLSTYSSSVHVVLQCALLLQLFPVRSIVVFKKNSDPRDGVIGQLGHLTAFQSTMLVVLWRLCFGVQGILSMRLCVLMPCRKNGHDKMPVMTLIDEFQ